MSIKKTDLSVPAGGSYRQFGYTPPNDGGQKKSNKSKKSDGSETENDAPGAVSSASPTGGTQNTLNLNMSRISQSGAAKTGNKLSTVNTGNINSAKKVMQAYENNQYNPQKITLEEDLDKLVKQLFPDLGVKFKVKNNGQITASIVNSSTKEVVREFPAEKMFDIIHSMSKKLGVVAKIKI